MPSNKRPGFVLSEDGTYPGYIVNDAAPAGYKHVLWYKWGWGGDTFVSLERISSLVSYDGRFGYPTLTQCPEVVS